MKKYVVIIIGCFFIWGVPTSSINAAKPQLAVGIGAGFPELWHLSGRISLTQQIQTGVRFAAFTYDDKDVIIATLDMQYHFGRSIKKVGDRSPWFVATGILYMDDENEKRRYEDIYLLTGLGWERSLIKCLGFQVDGGMAFRLSHESVTKVGTIFDFSFSDKAPFLFPFIRMQLFFYN
ncbi:MAG: hypothetical protein PHU88_08315 [candidate division Zixibacteria bacterium]|nr:hypothetical protein [candidate division Zixibacteria bacterium]MDD5425290.1 hypothetical protein [candidate division Zixibacteria bacterium]